MADGIFGLRFDVQRLVPRENMREKQKSEHERLDLDCLEERYSCEL